jgi:hypothetical protein
MSDLKSKIKFYSIKSLYTPKQNKITKLNIISNADINNQF